MIDKIIKKEVFELRIENVRAFQNQNRKTKFSPILNHRIPETLGKNSKKEKKIVFKANKTLEPLRIRKTK